MPWNVLLISDSRGGGLSKLIRQSISKDLNIKLEDRIHKGATLDDILKILERAGRRQHTSTWDTVIIAAGICNFTKRVIVTKNQFYIEYKDRKVEETRHLIDHILELFGNKAQICTIPPADIKNYSTHERHDQDIQAEQQHLIEDVEEINRHIIGRNINRDFATIDLAKQTYQSSLKTQGERKKRIVKFSAKGLRDGLHPTSEARTAWAKYMAKVIPQIIAKQQEKSTEDENENSGTEDERESWDHKRSKKPKRSLDM